MNKIYKFPKGFLWGTATSAHQIEGNNNNSDWWEWEQSKKYGAGGKEREVVHKKGQKRSESKVKTREYPLEPSGIACDSYNRYEEDFDLCVNMNNNAVRFGIEWARIEPGDGEFSKKEIEHYRKVLQAAKRRGLETFVTLHHFTNPIWFVEKGGWANPSSPRRFGKYSRKIAQELGDLIDVFLTINEPQVYTMQSYAKGIWPPNKINPILSLIVQLNMMRAHISSYKAIKKVNKKYKVGIVKNVVWYQTGSHIADNVFVNFMNFIGRDFFLRPLKTRLDLIGVNFYFTTTVRNFRTKNKDNCNSDLGWFIEPRGLQNVLEYLKSYNLPLYVTENGLADSKDQLRQKFIHDMLISCAKAIENGVDLRGYFHWSLLDNYEWHHGFWPRFGLIEIDRENGLKRVPRPSSRYYAKVCRENQIMPE